MRQKLLKDEPKTFRNLQADAIPTECLPNRLCTQITDRSRRRHNRQETETRKNILDEILNSNAEKNILGQSGTSQLENPSDEYKDNENMSTEIQAVTSAEPSISEL